MKKMMISFIVVLVLGLALCPTPVNGQGQKPILVWQTNMDSSSVYWQSLIITKTNDYVVSNNDTYTNYNLTCFSSQGNMLWQIKGNTAQIIDMNNSNSFLATNTNDKIITVFDYRGNIIRTVDPPANATNFKWISSIYKDTNHYYFVYTDSLNYKWSVFVYDNDLQYTGSFSLETGLFTVHGLITIGEYIYISRSGNGAGHQSNVVSDIYKYDQRGNMIWKKHLLDRTSMYLAESLDGNLYMGALNTSSPTKAWLSWEFAKIDTTGSFIWDKLWFNDYPDTVFSAMWPYDLKAIPGGGCIISGSATKLGLGDYVDPNNIEPVIVAFSDQGEKAWELRHATLPSKQVGEFRQIAWDAENYLIISGIICSQPWSQELYKYSIDGITAVRTESSDIPENYSLSQNYPNPFNPTTTINFSVPQSGQVSLKVYDLLGREVATLVNEELNTGNYSTKFEAGNLASGIYVYRLTAKNFVSSKKMMLMK